MTTSWAEVKPQIKTMTLNSRRKILQSRTSLGYLINWKPKKITSESKSTAKHWMSYKLELKTFSSTKTILSNSRIRQSRRLRTLVKLNWVCLKENCHWILNWCNMKERVINFRQPKIDSALQVKFNRKPAKPRHHIISKIKMIENKKEWTIR